MQIPFAYIGVILIWSTTPLAIKWSTEGVGYLFAVTSRMDIGVVIAILLSAMMGLGLPLHRKAILTYIASGVGATFVMLFSYISVQYIPSGWLSIIFGISPIMTSILASIFLGERLVSVQRSGSLLICIFGLYVMFQDSANIGDKIIYGALIALLGTVVYSLSLVAVKAINANIKPVSTMTGTLIVAALMLSLIWQLSGHELPNMIPARAAGAILYLGVIGSVLGFMLFFYLLQKIAATKVALITLITPLSALLLGYFLNNEPLTVQITSGALLVLFGLILFEFGGAIVSYYRQNLAVYKL